MGPQPATALSHCLSIVYEIMSLEVKVWNISNWHHHYQSIWVTSAPAASQVHLYLLVSASHCTAPMWGFRGWRGKKTKEKASAWSPSTRFLLLPHRRSKTARPGSPILPLNHLPCPRSCQDLPPQSLWAAAPTHPASSTQHPVAGGSSLSEGICVFREAGTGKLCTLQFKHSNAYE